MSSQDLESWAEERQSAWLYRVLAEHEGGARSAELYRELERAALRQAEVWAARARAQGRGPGPFLPSARARLVALLVRRLGARATRPLLAALKVRGLSALARGGHPMPTRLEEIGTRHARGGGNLRAAVFGVNDGLVSNASLMLGVAGASSASGPILLAGSAGLVAGALSMAAGEYLSVRSQREFLEHQLALERAELALYPDEEAEELALIYAARGMRPEEARALAAKLVSDPERALDALAREELGLDPHELGSPWGAALSSFVSFALGACVPLVPFLFGSGRPALLAGIGASALALFLVGAVLSLFTGRSAWTSGARMLAIGLGAGLATYAIGRLLGFASG